MIDRVRGIVRHEGAQAISLSIGAIDCVLQVPDSARFPETIETVVYVRMYWNQENGPSFYGFVSAIERQMFALLTNCSGVGPKVGLAALAELGVEGLVAAVQSENGRAISRVNGIGPKRAEQLIIQLRDKVTALVASGSLLMGINGSQDGLGSQAQAQAQSNLQTLREALESLNYSRIEITRAIDYVRKKEPLAPTFDQLMRQALSYLAQQS